jgi:hypothetical protein
MYAITELAAPPPFNADPAAINNNGDVAGSIWDPGSEHMLGAIWYADGSTLIIPDSFTQNRGSFLSDIDDEGTAIGVAGIPEPGETLNPENVFAVRNNVPSIVGMTPDEGAAHISGPVGKPHLACFTNEQGVVVAIDASTLSPAFAVTNFDPKTTSWAYSINSNNDVSGLTITLGVGHGSFLYRNGILMPDTPANGTIVKLNNSGKGGGFIGEMYQADQFPAIWDLSGPAPVSELVPVLKGFQNGWVNGINDAGVGVGGCVDASANFRAFVWKDQKAIDLNTMISEPGWELAIAWAINKSGQIVGTGALNGNPAGFLLTPLSPAAEFGFNIDVLLWAMLIGGGVPRDGGGPVLIGRKIPDWIGPLGPSVLSPAAHDVLIGLAVDAVSRQLGDRVGSEAIRKAAVEMTARAVNRLMPPTVSPSPGSARSVRAALEPALRRRRFPLPPRLRGALPEAT